MQNCERYFLVVAEELNITKAAKKVFVSQQSMSSHMKRMEEIYNVQLFVRKPKFGLTEAGERLADTLRKIKQLEDNLQTELRESENSNVGKLHVGMTWSRSVALLPLVLHRFLQEYPHVEVTVHNNLTDNLENRLIRGYLDLAISTADVDAAGLEVIPLQKENIYCVISDRLIRKHFPKMKAEEKEKLHREGVRLEQLRGIPLIMNTNEEHFSGILSPLLEEPGQEILFRSDSSDIRSQMCGMDLGYSIFAGLLMEYVYRQNTFQPEDNKLNVFPLIDAPPYNMVAYYHKSSFSPKYIRGFVEILQNVVTEILSGEIRGLRPVK